MTKTTNYQRGANFERQIINRFRSKGLYCIRSAGSKGIFDIIAIDFRLGEIKLIQVKNYKLGVKEYEKICADIHKLSPQPTAELHFYALEHTGRGVDRMTCIR